MNITPLKQKLLKVATRSHHTLQELNSKRWVIAPSEKLNSPPAIFLESDLNKITALMEDTTLEQEMQRIRGGEIEHAATIAYQIQHCELLNGNLYKNTVRYPLTKQKPALFNFDKQITINEAALAGSYYGSFYFGHWLTDDLTAYLAAESYAQPIIPERKPYIHEPSYLELTEINPQGIKSALFKSLIIFDDFGQNKFKRERYETIRTRLLKVKPTDNNEKVFIRRGQQGATRVLSNAEQIEQLLITQGFKIINPETLTVNQLIAEIQGAKLIVGLEGSHLMHCIYSMSLTGALCVLQPPFRFNNVLKNYTDCLGINYGFVVGSPDENGFNINTDDLLTVLEKLHNTL